MIFTNKDLIIDPDPILRHKCAKVDFPLSDEDRNLYDGLREYVINSLDEELVVKYDLSPAVGIAAPQVGQNKQMCAIYIENEEGKAICDIVLINPRIIAHSVEQTYLENGEACLSIRDEHPGIVHRYAYIKVRYQDLNGNTKVLELNDFMAVAFQHEIDHLNGILFYDHIDSKNPYKIKPNSFPL